MRNQSTTEAAKKALACPDDGAYPHEAVVHFNAGIGDYIDALAAYYGATWEMLRCGQMSIAVVDRRATAVDLAGYMSSARPSPCTHMVQVLFMADAGSSHTAIAYAAFYDPTPASKIERLAHGRMSRIAYVLRDAGNSVLRRLSKETLALDVDVPALCASAHGHFSAGWALSAAKESRAPAGAR